MGVEVRTNTRVTRVEADAVWFGAERVATRTVLWAAGNQAQALGAAASSHVDQSGRVRVSADLSLPEDPDILVAGDLALTIREDGTPVPAVAPAAMQMGRCAGENVLRSLRRQARRPFRYVNKGELATIGRYRAVGVVAGVEVRGPVAWWLWLFIHILYLAGFRNRVSVLLQWGWSYLTWQRGVRLIVDSHRR
jgi:NADH dehydrogenase